MSLEYKGGIIRNLKNKKLKIAYKEYEIIKKPEVIDLPRECYGTVNYLTQTIEISTKAKQDEQNVTFLHEMFHAIFNKLDMEDLCEDEVVVNQLATELYMVIKDNPHIFTMKDI